MATGLVADVTQQDEISAQIDRYEAHTGPIDILVNNAGMQHRAPLESFEADVFDQMIAVNLKAAFYTAKALSAFMIARQHGRIINIASVMSLLARPGIAPYAATKGAIEALTKSLAAELGPKNIRVNCVAPGAVYTEINQRAGLFTDEEALARLNSMKDLHALGRIGEVSEVAEAVGYFLSAEWVTGAILEVDGGLALGLTKG